ncbi:decapping and exoribonuclease protein-like [Wyeomyia smithii]|uniref:decapping and exoribonuclease protein-like n=1 Tax=Wyeomyia smithii TaxID=174621 RepID=UPI002467ADCF|nr:decapping and exoribonuclease protein-like [Wyeomyia smithii]
MDSTHLNPFAVIQNTRSFPSVSKPKIVGFFSVGSERQYLDTADNLKYLNLPKPDANGLLRIDLNNGFGTRLPKPASAKQERIDHLLQFIILNRGKGDSVPYDFVCFRGLLRMLMCTPYERDSGWIVLASRYKGTIYLCAKDTPEKLRQEANETEQQKRFCYYGFKFEQHILTDEPGSEPNTSAPVSESEEFCSLFSSTLEGKRILYGAEMDGILPEKPVDRTRIDAALLNGLQFIEVKVKRRETNQRQVDNFYRYKTIKWWCQSFLVNVQRIFVGLRNDRGIVDEIREMSLEQIDRDSRRFWSASVCMAFCAEFLELVRTKMSQVDSPHTVYCFEYRPEKAENVLLSVLEGCNEESFLPDWYFKAAENE